MNTSELECVPEGRVADHLAVVVKADKWGVVRQEGGDGDVVEAHAQVRDDWVDCSEHDIEQRRGDEQIVDELARPCAAHLALHTRRLVYLGLSVSHRRIH